MSDLYKAAQQALDALEGAWRPTQGLTKKNIESAIEALREALAKPAVPTPKMIFAANRSCRNDEQCENRWEPSTCKHCIEATAEDLKAALAAAPQPKVPE